MQFFFMPRYIKEFQTNRDINNNDLENTIAQQQAGSESAQAIDVNKESFYKLGSVFCKVKSIAESSIVVEAYAPGPLIKGGKKDLSISITGNTEITRFNQENEEQASAKITDISAGDYLEINFNKGYLINEVNEAEAKSISIKYPAQNTAR